MWGRLTKHTAGEEEYGRPHCGIDGDPLDQTDAGRGQEQSQHHQGRNHGHDLFSASLARTCSRDVLADLGSAIRALAASLEDQVGIALGTFNPGSKRHRLCALGLPLRRASKPTTNLWSAMRLTPRRKPAPNPHGGVPPKEARST